LLYGIRQWGPSNGAGDALGGLPDRLWRLCQAPTRLIPRALRAVQISAYESDCDAYYQPQHTHTSEDVQGQPKHASGVPMVDRDKTKYFRFSVRVSSRAWTV
jgi:hypothetical protein